MVIHMRTLLRAIAEILPSSGWISAGRPRQQRRGNHEGAGRTHGAHGRNRSSIDRATATEEEIRAEVRRACRITAVCALYASIPTVAGTILRPSPLIMMRSTAGTEHFGTE
jgi:hypothetical protein